MTSIIFALCFLLLALPRRNDCNTSWAPISSASSMRLQPVTGEVQKCLGVELYFFLSSFLLPSCLRCYSRPHGAMQRGSAGRNSPQISSEHHTSGGQPLHCLIAVSHCQVAVLKWHVSEWFDCCYLTISFFNLRTPCSYAPHKY